MHSPPAKMQPGRCFPLSLRGILATLSRRSFHFPLLCPSTPGGESRILMELQPAGSLKTAKLIRRTVETPLLISYDGFFLQRRKKFSTI